MGAIILAHESDVCATPNVTTVCATTWAGLAAGSSACRTFAADSFASLRISCRETTRGAATCAFSCFSHSHFQLLALCVTLREISHGLYLLALSLLWLLTITSSIF